MNSTRKIGIDKYQLTSTCTCIGFLQYIFIVEVRYEIFQKYKGLSNIWFDKLIVFICCLSLPLPNELYHKYCNCRTCGLIFV